MSKKPTVIFFLAKPRYFLLGVVQKVTELNRKIVVAANETGKGELFNLFLYLQAPLMKSAWSFSRRFSGPVLLVNTVIINNNNNKYKKKSNSAQADWIWFWLIEINSAGLIRDRYSFLRKRPHTIWIILQKIKSRKGYPPHFTLFVIFSWISNVFSLYPDWNLKDIRLEKTFKSKVI